MFLVTLAIGGFCAYQGWSIAALLFGIWTGLIYAMAAEEDEEIA